MTAFKTCTRCGEMKFATVEFFGKQARGKFGLASWCRECAASYRKAHYQANREATLEANATWAERNREKRQADAAALYQSRREEILAQQAAAKRANPEAFRAKGRRASKRWRDANPEKARQHERNRRARELNAPGTHTAEDVVRQVRNQEGRCYWCGQPLEGATHVDHIVPLSRGGTNGPENICVAHEVCNLSKHNKMPWEYNGRLI